MGYLPDAPTADELAKLRSDGQFSRFYLVVDNPTIVFRARVNGAPASHDMVHEVAYDGGSGVLEDVLPGMTLWVGSTPDSYDKGQARIRKPPDSNTLFIGEESEIQISDGDYLTVVDEFGLWVRRLRIEGETPLMDYDIAYTDQHTNRAPVVVLGGFPAVGWLGGDGKATISADASGSWVPGAVGNTYSWSAPGAVATTGLDTATPTFTYDAPGRYRVSCAVTIGGQTSVRYGYVHIFSDAQPPITQFTLASPPTVTYGEGVAFAVTLYDEADLSAVRDRAQVILFSRDFYQGEEGSLGWFTGRNNIRAVGWIVQEQLSRTPELGTVTFEVRGPHYWLARLPARVLGVEDTVEVPDAWTKYNNLTVTAMLWHLLVWRTTAPLAIDCLVQESTIRAAALEGPAASVWEQINAIAFQSILARPSCDRWSRLFVAIDAQLLPVASRAGIQEVMTLTDADLRERLELTRSPMTRAAQVDMSGIIWNGTEATAVCVLAPGHVTRRWGSVEVLDRLRFSSAAQAIELAGLYAGWLNNEYPVINARLAANNPYFDVVPSMYAVLPVSAEDFPRGVSGTLRALPRRVTYNIDPQAGTVLVDLELEAETFAEPAVQRTCPGGAPAPSEPPGEPTSTPGGTGRPKPFKGPVVAHHWNDVVATVHGFYLAGSEVEVMTGIPTSKLQKRRRSDGAQLWEITLTEINPSEPAPLFWGGFPTAIRLATDGSYLYVAGNAGPDDWVLEKRYLGSGALIWRQTISLGLAGDEDSAFGGLDVDSTGLYLAGGVHDPEHVTGRYVLQKRALDDGDLLWDKAVVTGHAPGIFSVRVSPTGARVHAVGTVALEIFPGIFYNGILVAQHVAANGLQEWERRIPNLDPLGGALGHGVGAFGDGVYVLAWESDYEGIHGVSKMTLHKLRLADGEDYPGWSSPVELPVNEGVSPGAMRVLPTGVYVAYTNGLVSGSEGRVTRRFLHNGAEDWTEILAYGDGGGSFDGGWTDFPGLFVYNGVVYVAEGWGAFAAVVDQT